MCLVGSHCVEQDLNNEAKAERYASYDNLFQNKLNFFKFKNDDNEKIVLYKLDELIF